MRESSDEVIIMTDDGSYGRKGLVTEGVEEVIKREKVDKCFAIGPAIMMKFVCLLTKKYEIRQSVLLNTIMVDGTGMRCLPYHCREERLNSFCRWSGIRRSPGEFRRNAERMGAFKNIEREEMHKLESECEANQRNR